MTKYDTLTRDELIDRIESLEDQLADADGGYSRRSVIAAAAGVAAAGAAGVFSTGVASAAPTGTFPASGDDALLKIRADRVRLVARSSDPSTPDDGTMWYRGGL
ncbi:hypothetical protein [Halarchaeum salinum]|uniref:Tat (Twin-arginine translocation) pathway signal sequence n=1 Tax=Halarchaeum salinum TaxID=489912 RepID=A0AAV3S9C7_9EURY